MRTSYEIFLVCGGGEYLESLCDRISKQNKKGREERSLMLGYAKTTPVLSPLPPSLLPLLSLSPPECCARCLMFSSFSCSERGALPSPDRLRPLFSRSLPSLCLLSPSNTRSRTFHSVAPLREITSRFLFSPLPFRRSRHFSCKRLFVKVDHFQLTLLHTTTTTPTGSPPPTLTTPPPSAADRLLSEMMLLQEMPSGTVALN